MGRRAAHRAVHRVPGDWRPGLGKITYNSYYIDIALGHICIYSPKAPGPRGPRPLLLSKAGPGARAQGPGPSPGPEAWTPGLWPRAQSLGPGLSAQNAQAKASARRRATAQRVAATGTPANREPESWSAARASGLLVSRSRQHARRSHDGERKPWPGRYVQRDLGPGPGLWAPGQGRWPQALVPGPRALGPSPGPKAPGPGPGPGPKGPGSPRPDPTG